MTTRSRIDSWIRAAKISYKHRGRYRACNPVEVRAVLKDAAKIYRIAEETDP